MRLCPYCRSERRSRRVEAREMSQATRESFAYLVCGDCGSARIAEMPADIGNYYQGYYSLDATPRRPTAATLAKRAAAALLRPFIQPASLRTIRTLLRHPPRWAWPILSPNLQAFLYLGPSPRARIIDVGSGNGAFVANLRRLGFREARGIDPLIDAGRLPHRDGLVRRGRIEDVAGQFDVITFNHSLEHMPSPRHVLDHAAGLLAPGGTIVVHIPNIESVEFQRFGGDWWGLHAPRHFTLPTARGLSLAARSAGLGVSDRIFTSRYDNYLYSAEYERGIADHDPGSLRAGGPRCVWSRRDIGAAAERAMIHNATGEADWVCYYLTHADESRWTG
ncbi:MAG: class I SAM-dependent methyltransferase [Magnetospirillum sp.]|nr:class I SAM-dependent methyltransferase [Magnetospirillum sp.]